MTRVRGSCHCGRVAWALETQWVHPIMWCYCSRCRKTAGAPMASFVKGRKERFRVTAGEEQLREYRIATNHRYFCGVCGSALYMHDDRQPEFRWALASSVDSPLPSTDRYVHIHVGSKPSWFTIHTPGPQFPGDAPETGDAYHRNWGLA